MQCHQNCQSQMSNERKSAFKQSELHPGLFSFLFLEEIHSLRNGTEFELNWPQDRIQWKRNLLMLIERNGAYFVSATNVVFLYF